MQTNIFLSGIFLVIYTIPLFSISPPKVIVLGEEKFHGSGKRRVHANFDSVEFKVRRRGVERRSGQGPISGFVQTESTDMVEVMSVQFQQYIGQFLKDIKSTFRGEISPTRRYIIESQIRVLE
jgi:hypothetical protein